MYFEFYLDDLEIEEPQGFADIVLNMKRDDNWHGIFFEASTSELAFYGAAATYLKNKKNTEGLKSDVTFKALHSCGIYEDLEVIFEGKLDFGKCVESCGKNCIIRMPVEQTGCLMTLRNRYDQKVDIYSTVTFSKLSALQQYDKINFDMELPAVPLQSQVAGSVSQDGYSIECLFLYANPNVTIFWRPNYDIERSNTIETGQLQGINNMESSLGPEQTDCVNGPITPQLLLEQGEIDCFDGNFSYTSRMKGVITTNIPNPSDEVGPGKIKYIKQVIYKWDGVTGGSIIDGGDLVYEVIIADYSADPVAAPSTISFDNTVSGTTTLPEEYGFYAIMDIELVKNDDFIFSEISININWDSDTTIDISAVKLCPSSTADSSMINETLSRVTEAITDNCLKIKSDYYGRIDSQPYTSAEDGCGSLRTLSSGLQIRRSVNPAFFVSLKELFEGLRAIDNIGIGIESNPYIPGFEWLRIEQVDYFYQGIEILTLPYIPEADISVQEQLHYSLIKTGYQKWEVERINGLDEPNSNREYRTSLTSVNNTLDITSRFIAGSYAIESTRQQSFADTGAADTTYDNETFIICVERQGYSFIVERGNISNAANIFSPQTLYNWRIRPYSNLMRWFKSIANSYPNINDSDNRIYFSSGTGNFIAEGQLNSANCKIENGIKEENRDLSKLDFGNAADAIPLWKPEYATLKYPLSVADYKTIKANPYGYISFQCGTGEWKKGFIQDIRYRLNKGEADFTLKLKYE